MYHICKAAQLHSNSGLVYKFKFKLKTNLQPQWKNNADHVDIKQEKGALYHITH